MKSGFMMPLERLILANPAAQEAFGMVDGLEIAWRRAAAVEIFRPDRVTSTCAPKTRSCARSPARKSGISRKL